VGASGRVLWALIILGMVALVVALPLAVRSRFEGAPTLLVGDYVLVDKGVRWPARGDLVVFTDPSDANEILVKRIVGLSGEEIVVHADFTDEVRAAKDVGPLQIPSGAVFVMADNWNAGEDSRHWGPVPREQIFGRPVWIYRSSDADGHPRWSRVGRRVR
jgi:signal peptidase I